MSAQTSSQPPRFKIPPEERFWKRYSPNLEFPLSSVLALALFATILGIMIVSIKLEWFSQPTTPDLGTMALGDENLPGPVKPSGKNGVFGNGQPRRENVSQPREGTVKPGPELPRMPGPVGKPEPLPDAPPLLPDLPAISFDRIGAEARKKLERSIAGTPEGTGPDGPPGPTGSGSGQRLERVYRWHIMLDTRSGEHYLKQLQFLKAYIGQPEKAGAGKLQYRIFRDLTHLPASGKIEDVNRLNRFFAVDTKPESVRALASALGLTRQSYHLVVFFPRALEEELARKELAYRGRTESQIAATQFHILWRGKDYDVQVTDQRVK